MTNFESLWPPSGQIVFRVGEVWGAPGVFRRLGSDLDSVEVMFVTSPRCVCFGLFGATHAEQYGESPMGLNRTLGLIRTRVFEEPRSEKDQGLGRTTGLPRTLGLRRTQSLRRTQGLGRTVGLRGTLGLRRTRNLRRSMGMRGQLV